MLVRAVKPTRHHGVLAAPPRTRAGSVPTAATAGFASSRQCLPPLYSRPSSLPALTLARVTRTPARQRERGAGAVMSLTPWEDQILDSIKDRISRSDPRLAALLAIFTKLAADEQMPLGENIRVTPRAFRRPGRRRRRRVRRMVRAPVSRARHRFGDQRLALALWLVISVALVATALLLNRGAQGAGCTPASAFACASPSSTHSPQTTASSHGSPG